MTAALRFDREMGFDMSEFKTNLVPFPRLHFMTTSLAPVISKAKNEHEDHNCRRITDDCLQPSSFLVKYSDFDVVEDKYMALGL
jgi:tubulin alpha